MAKRRTRGRPAPVQKTPTAREIAAELLKLGEAGYGSAPTAVPVSSSYLQQLQVGQMKRPGSGLPWTDDAMAFGPGVPISPTYIDPPRGDVVSPRRYEYPVSWNLPGQAVRTVPWDVLRQLADTSIIARKCIEMRKDQIVDLHWDVVVDSDEVNRIVSESNDSKDEADKKIREKYSGKIAEIRDFWERPDKKNNYSMADFIRAVVEEIMVTDAVSIYPVLTLGKKLHSLRLIDGSTIKPLLDNEGDTPEPPNVAYQQILYGFPRGEFSASPADSVDYEMSASDMLYRPMNRRTQSPYGYSCTEQAIMAVDLYLKREDWLRAEFTDGVIPELMIHMRSESPTQMSPDQLKAYEAIFNDDLSGRTKDRHRARFLPPGFEVAQMTSSAEKYDPRLDEYIIKLTCMAYSVLPEEIGFSDGKQLQGKGTIDLIENSVYRKAVKPLTTFLVALFNEISRKYLGMPKELTFKFHGEESEDAEMRAKVEQIEISIGEKTLNELRTSKGEPCYEGEWADKPYVITPGGPVFLEHAWEAGKAMMAGGQLEGQQNPSHPLPIPGGNPQNQPTRQLTPASNSSPANPGQPKKVPSLAQARSTSGQPRKDGGTAVPNGQAIKKEADAFLKYASKRAGKDSYRRFNFDHINAATGQLLNLRAALGQMDTVKAILNEIA